MALMFPRVARNFAKTGTTLPMSKPLSGSLL